MFKKAALVKKNGIKGRMLMILYILVALCGSFQN